tara:strand:+ start:255 stop:539 length:285 start_codon:yes stop_codon:yes gene_type:complete
MKITKSQLKQIIKEELNEITDDDVDMMPAPSGTAQGISVVKQHLGEMVAELQPAGLGPDLSQTMGRTGHTGIAPDLDRLAIDIYKMIMGEPGGQ